MHSNVITAVRQDGKNRHRYQVFVDGEFAFDVHEDILIAYNLLKGTIIEPGVADEILAAEERHRAYLAALRYLGIRPRTAHQLERYLTEKGFSPELVHDIRRQCQDEGYVDDYAFARQWVSERLYGKQRGTFALRLELAQKGISREIADAAVGEIDPEEELAAARRFAVKRLRRLTGPVDAAKERKLLAALQRKGFSAGTMQAIRRELREGRLDDPLGDSLDNPRWHEER